MPRRIVLHRITFKGTVKVVKFSPDGKFIAVGLGKLVQIWRSPGFEKQFLAFELVRTFAGCKGDVTCVDWCPESRYLLVGSKDLTVRLFSMRKTEKTEKKDRPFMFLGHRDVIVGAFFGVDKSTNKVNHVYTLSRDGAVFGWSFSKNEPESPGTPEQRMEVDGNSNVKKRKKLEEDGSEGVLDDVKWELVKKDFFMQAPAKLTACDYHKGLELLVVGFSNGVFGLYQMPDFVCIHLLSISREKITTATFNELGNWLTFGCAKLGQLLVWEWKSESYILKQQGHYFDVNTIAYSPDSQLLATGADDNKIKVS